MEHLCDSAALRGLLPGSHVGWIVSDPGEYVELGAAVLARAAETGEKPVVFGPDGSARDALAGLALLVADPRTAFLGGGPLEPSAMFAVFEEQSMLARSEGYRGLCLVADMDWLLALQPSNEDLVSFELLLDRHAARLGATIVCAYRRESFSTSALTSASCVHPIGVGELSPPQFKLIAGEHDGWQLLGEVDIAVMDDFKTAINTAVGAGPCVIDASRLKFVDVAGMRQLAEAAEARATPVRLLGVRPVVERSWALGRFAEIAPTVELVG